MRAETTQLGVDVDVKIGVDRMQMKQEERTESPLLLEARGLCKSYRRPNGESLEAVKTVDLSLKKGEFVQIMGRSGSGKTTLLSILAAMLEAEEGSLWLEGKPYPKAVEEERASFRNSKLGIVPQQTTLLAALTVLENVCLPWILQKREGDVLGKARYLLDKLGIRALEQERPAKLSGGELRRVQIARALICEPVLLLADEPTSDLDEENSLAVMRLLQQLNEEGLGILMVTHDRQTLRFAQRLCLMEEGRLRELSTAERAELLQTPVGGCLL